MFMLMLELVPVNINGLLASRQNSNRKWKASKQRNGFSISYRNDFIAIDIIDSLRLDVAVSFATTTATNTIAVGCGTTAVHVDDDDDD